MKPQFDFYQKYLDLLKTYYPSASSLFYEAPSCQRKRKSSHNWQSSDGHAGKHRLPISSMRILLPKKAIQQMKDLVRVLYQLSNLKEYRELIQKSDRKLNAFNNVLNQDSSSLLMAYDFHWSEEKLHLIEVNTNASGYLISELVDQVHGKQSAAIFYLKNAFEAEWRKWQKTSASPQHLCLVDREVKKQKMFLEFLMFKDLLSAWNWSCQIKDIKELQLNTNGQLVDLHFEKVDMIYNRLTDFYFNHTPVMKQAFLSQTCHISPGPLSYYLLADKSRLCIWRAESFLNQLSIKQEDKNILQQLLPSCGFVHSADSEKLWANRKEFFFKPLQGYGGKAVYRGRSITRSKFKELIQTASMYQKYIPPGVWTDSNGTKWKYDIRAYVYQDQLQHLTARVYQGQVTGFDREGSGFASILVQ